MAEKIGNGFIKIAESGINDVNNIHYLKQHGFQGFLIGEYFMKQEDPGRHLKSLLINYKIMKIKVCGMTSIRPDAPVGEMGVDLQA